MERYKKNIYGIANSFKTKEERMVVLTVYRQRLLKLLKEGYSPYDDNTEKFNSYQQKSEAKTEQGEKVLEVQSKSELVKADKVDVEKEELKEDKGMGLKEALDFDYRLKQVQLRESSLRSYKSHIKVFNEWIQNERPEIEFIGQVDKKLVVSFLTSLLETSTPRNRNNYRASLSSLFQTLEYHVI